MAWAEKHAPYTKCLPRPVWKELNVPNIESIVAKVLLSNLYTVLKTEDDYYLKVVNNVCLTLLLKIHLGQHDADKNNLG